jgi:hypothetical protein
LGLIKVKRRLLSLAGEEPSLPGRRGMFYHVLHFEDPAALALGMKIWAPVGASYSTIDYSTKV